ncbi:MAG TPA: hypothetical protein VIL37_07605 [Natronosporangium sp.]
MTSTQEETRRREPDPDAIRTEAERLVAAGLAAVSMVADRIGAPTRERGGAAAAGFDALGDMLFGPAGHRRHSVANDSPECCKCPVCRVIAAARQPSPGFAERLASGVGMVAEATARMMRTVADVTSMARPAPSAPPAADSPPPTPASTPPAEASTPPTEAPAAPTEAPAAAPEPPAEPEPRAATDEPDDPWAAATADAAAAATTPPPAKPVAKKKVAKKAVAKKAVAKKAVKKAAVKKAAAKPKRATGASES